MINKKIWLMSILTLFLLMLSVNAQNIALKYYVSMSSNIITISPYFVYANNNTNVSIDALSYSQIVNMTATSVQLNNVNNFVIGGNVSYPSNFIWTKMFLSAQEPSISDNSLNILLQPNQSLIKSGMTLSNTSNTFSITNYLFDIKAYPKLNLNVNSIMPFGEVFSYINNTYGVNIDLTAPSFPKINKDITLSLGQDFINTTYNISVNAPSKLNKNITLIAPQKYINTTYNLTVNTNYPKLNINKTLSFGSSYSNSILNISLFVPAITPNTINDSILTQYYNNEMANCVETTNIITNNGVFSYCQKTATKNFSVLNLCLASQLRNVSGLSACMQNAFLLANESAVSWKEQYNASQRALQLTEQNYTALNKSDALALKYQQTEETTFEIILIMVGFTIVMVMIYMGKRRFVPERTKK